MYNCEFMWPSALSFRVFNQRDILNARLMTCFVIDKCFFRFDIIYRLYVSRADLLPSATHR